MTDELWNKGLARANRGHISTFMRHQNLTGPNMILIGEAPVMRNCEHIGHSWGQQVNCFAVCLHDRWSPIILNGLNIWNTHKL